MDDDDLDFDDVADLVLTYMHADGAPCPDADHSRQVYADLDVVDRLLREHRDHP